MKFAKKLIAMLIAMAMVAGLMACNNGGDEIEETEEVTTTTTAAKEDADDADDDVEEDVEEDVAEDTIDRSEEITLVMYFTGNEPNDMAMVEDAANEILLEKFNAKVDFQFSTWTDYTTKYNNELVTGGVDIIFTADWMSYKSLAAKEAFLPLDDLLPAYAAELTEAIGEDKLNACRVNGKIYCFPNTWDEYVTDGIVYRKDLAEKYDVAEPIDNLENLEEYFDTLVDNAEDAGLIAMFDATGSTNTAATLWNTTSALLVYNWDNEPYLGMNYGYLYDEENPYELIDYYFSDQFVEDALKLKEWCDNGWWSKSIMSATSDTESLTDGTTAATVSGANVNKYTGWVRDIATKEVEGAELAWWEYSAMNGDSYPVAAIHNGTAITATCKYPERAMEVLNYIMMDAEMNALIQCGIEGYHYNIDENGYYVATEEGNNNYAYEAADTWNFRNGDLKLKRESDVEQDEIFARMAEQSSKCLYPLTDVKSGFGEDYTEYETERMAVLAILEEYAGPIFAGTLADPEATIEEFRAKLEASEDWAVVREAYVAQWQAYCEEYGYTDSRR